MSTRIIMFGDIVGKPGRSIVQQHLSALRREYRADLVIANAENAAGGSGITPPIYQKLMRCGVDGITLGDHAFRQRDAMTLFDNDKVNNLIRPANLPTSSAGKSWMKLTSPGGVDLYVVTLLGRIFVSSIKADDPFAAVDRILGELPAGAIVLVEMHAEATSEKVAMGHYLDGRVAAVIGSHTHIPTADAKILPGGTAYMTDMGMCGPYDSVLGRRTDRVLQFMTTAMPAQFDVAEGDVRICGVFIELSDSGKALDCKRIEYSENE